MGTDEATSIGVSSEARPATTAHLRSYRLDDRYVVERGSIYLTGIQALVRLPLDQVRLDRRAGRRTAVFISGYEGSPLGGYDLELMRRRPLLEQHDVVFQPGVNEELAATAVQGTQLLANHDARRYEGVAGLWYGKSPGLDRAADAMRHNNLMGTDHAGGALAVVGDDAAAKSSTVPGSSELLLASLGLPTLYPCDSQDVLDLGVHGLALSRASGLWVALKIAVQVADGASVAEVAPDRIVPVLPEIDVAGGTFRHQVTGKLLQPALTPLERSLTGFRMEMARRYAAANRLNRLTVHGRHDRIGIVAAGKTYLDLRQALRTLGLDDEELQRRGVRLLQLRMLFPLDPDIIAEFAADLDEIVVVEEKRAFIEVAIKEQLYGRANAPAISGKSGPDGTTLFPAEGELDPDLIAKVVAARLLAHGGFTSVQAWSDTRRTRASRVSLPLLARTPHFCSGCPHNTSTKVPHGSLVGAGIGCHTLALMMDESQVGTITGVSQMGGEGAQWIGMAPFLERDHLLQNIGDGTFHHSGSLALRAAVAAGVNITYKLLHNSAVAMTGGQQPAGAMPMPMLARMLLAEGVQRIIITTDNPKQYHRVRLPRGVQVRHRKHLVSAQAELANIRGVTVLIHDQDCATELRRKRNRGLSHDPTTRVLINERVCEGCGDCGVQSNCLSVRPITTEFGRKTQIHQPSCNKDYSCLDGDCPSFLTVTTGKRANHPMPPALHLDELAEPDPRVSVDRCAIRITGVGGTGVVTLAQILGTAGVIAGRHVRGLDQIGLAQKGGAVVSDLKFTTEPVEQANKVANGECDLYLGCDLLVAADQKNLQVIDPNRTIPIVSTAEVPTGQMVVDTTVSFPDQSHTVQRIRESVRADYAVFLDARRLSEELFADDQFANLLLAGAAYQAGGLPLPTAAIERAIELNGVQVEYNVQAFRRGRQAVADPAALATTLQSQLTRPERAAATPAAAAELVARVDADRRSELARLVGIRVPDLIAYQDVRYARQYVDFVEHTRAREAELTPGRTALAEAVARYLYKLMAYKDEYEVARLSIAPEVTAQIHARFGPGARYGYRLHPPVLRAMGLRNKITLGPWVRPALMLLHRMRRLRGTRFDPFGHTPVRRLERRLIEEYREVIEELLTGLKPKTHDRAVEIAALPDMVRGYEEIKARNAERYRHRLHELRDGYRQSVLSTPG